MTTAHGRTGLRLTTIGFTINIDEDLAIGNSGASGDDDRPVIVDGLDRAIIPGTSLAGVLRQQARDRLGETAANHLFGDPVAEDGQGRIEIDDIVIASDLAQRDGVGIDRFTGTAAAQVLYNLEVVPAGAVGSGEVRLRSGDSSLHDLLVALMVDVTAEGFCLGSGVTRGRGSVSLDDVTVTSRRLDDRDALLAQLGIGSEPAAVGISQWEPLAPHSSDDASNRGHDPTASLVSIVVPFAAVTPLFTASGDTSDIFASMPLTTTVDHPDGRRVHLLLPGSSVKGALRSHAERIERTVRGVGLEHAAADGDGFLAQLSDGGTPTTSLLFGAALRHTDTDRFGGKSLLWVRSTRSKWSCTQKQWHAIASATKAGSADSLSQVRPLLDAVSVHPGADDDRRHTGVLRAGTHNAIDRWSGGVADGAVFTVLEPHAVQWDDLRLEAHLPVTGAGLTVEHQAAVFLLLLVLRDLADGWIGLGAGVNRGYGTVGVAANDLTLTGVPGVGSTSLAALMADPDKAADLAAAWTTLTQSEHPTPHEEAVS